VSISSILLPPYTPGSTCSVRMAFRRSSVRSRSAPPGFSKLCFENTCHGEAFRRSRAPGKLPSTILQSGAECTGPTSREDNQTRLFCKAVHLYKKLSRRSRPHLWKAMTDLIRRRRRGSRSTKLARRRADQVSSIGAPTLYGGRAHDCTITARQKAP